MDTVVFENKIFKVVQEHGKPDSFKLVWKVGGGQREMRAIKTEEDDES